MSYFAWTDAGGSATLGNSKPYPGSRFMDWNPSNKPFGVKSNTLSTGELNVVAFRDDLLIALALPAIPNTSMATMLRLQMHLKRGGIVTLVTEDETIPVFGDVKLAPGADVQIKQTDAEMLEYTLSTVLRGTAGSTMSFGVSTTCEMLPLGLSTADPLTMTFDGYVLSASLFVSPRGSITVDVLKNGSSICGGDPLTIADGTKDINRTLAGWDVDFVIGDTFTIEITTGGDVSGLVLRLPMRRVPPP